MSTSIRSIAGCLGVNSPLSDSFLAPISVTRDILGFWNGAPRTVSLLEQIERVQGPHVHMNFILVGADQFTPDDMREIDMALEITRDVYGRVGLGVGRVERYAISTVAALGADDIHGDDEAVELTGRWTVHNHSIDIFWVRSYAGVRRGLSPTGGPCDKDSKGMTGSVVALEGSYYTMAITLAHEAGHYLGLEHVDDSNNLMDEHAQAGKLTPMQGATMIGHCFVNQGC